MIKLVPVTYQANQHGLLGRGPSSKANAGCVLCSSYMALLQLGCIDNSVSLEAFHAKALESGAFDDPGLAHDMLDVPKAVAPWGCHAEADHVTEDISASLADCLGGHGVALVRVAFTPGNTQGNHTILAAGYADFAGAVECLDPAIGHVTLAADLTATGLGWGHDSEGKHILKDYHTVNIRRLFRI